MYGRGTQESDSKDHADSYPRIPAIVQNGVHPRVPVWIRSSGRPIDHGEQQVYYSSYYRVEEVETPDGKSAQHYVHYYVDGVDDM